ncbi:MAG: DUF1343 domain-containing protein [Bacteroidales bacterium]|nr:DUF1343 domain-containing protein [Bacteroidales bacterium]
MRRLFYKVLMLCAMLYASPVMGQSKPPFGMGSYKIVLRDVTDKEVRVGAARTQVYLPFIQGKKIAVCANHTALIGQTHLVDSLHALGVDIVRIFAPEHGFRGRAEAGQTVANDTDAKTGIPIVSLYGKRKKPTAEDMQGIDLVLFDIQDVGARFYTYISTLHYLMEAAAENKVTIVVLDRPNPNGFWVDGPVLKPQFSSFVGMHPVPVVHGMTVGEYALMINGEKWLKNGLQCDLKIVNVERYDHALRYQLPNAPSPNLPTMEAIYLYPSLCLFEGTPLSVGRGTDKPFRLLGYPDCPDGNTQFKPKSIPGVALHPPFENKKCKGYDLSEFSLTVLKNQPFLHIDLLIEMYKNYPDKARFFLPVFTKLAGTDQLQKQIEAGLSAEAIHASWKEELEQFKRIRKKYLLYADFE